MTTIRAILADQPNRPRSDKFVLASIRVKNASERALVEKWLKDIITQSVCGPADSNVPDYVFDSGRGRING